jgi:hypothetical protein
MQQLVGALGPNKDAALTALIETYNERLAGDEGIQQSLRQRYQELEALGAAKQKADRGPLPVPINPPSLDEYTPYGRFDPYQALHEYGPAQLRAVLELSTQRDLREATDIVQSRTGIKPAGRTRKADMVEYIMQQVVGIRD